MPWLQSVNPPHKVGYSIIAALFFNVGFFASINGVLVTYFKNSFHLSYLIANVIPFVYFITYFCMSSLFGFIAYHSNYVRTMQLSLLLGIAGCSIFIGAVNSENFILILLGLFLIASFSTGVEVSANPLVDSMGAARYSSQRLTFVHLLDSVGTIIGPQFAAFIFLYSISRQQLNLRIDCFYLFLIIVLGIFIYLLHQSLHPTDLRAHKNTQKEVLVKSQTSIWYSKQLLLGFIAMFIYVGCEVSVANFLMSFAILPEIAGTTIKAASIWLSLYWAGMMVGRLLASFLMGKTNTYLPLAGCGFIATILLSTALLIEGPVSLWLVTLVGLANSIMYPAIFSIAIAHFGNLKSKASGILHMGVVGGAVIPLIQGAIADHIGVAHSYWFLAVLYIFIIYYALTSMMHSRKSLGEPTT